MKIIRNAFYVLFAGVAVINSLRAQETDSDLAVMILAIEQTTPTPAESLPGAGTFWSAQHAPGSLLAWPPLPGNLVNVPAWGLGDGVFLLDDTNVDYDELQAEADAATALAARFSPRIRMSMVASSLASSYAYGNPVYLTNMAAVFAGDGSMTAIFGIGGGTNFVPYDILMTTNVAESVSQWTWLGIGYTSNNYTFYEQPADLGFYILAKPSKTMAVAWGENYFGQCDVPAGIANAVMLAGGGGYTIALLNNGTVVGWGGRTIEGSVPTNLTGIAMIASGVNHKVVMLTNGLVEAWGDNTFGETNVPSNLTNATVISAQYLHTMALRSNGTVVSWGDIDSSSGENDVPAGLTNATAIAAGGEFDLAVSNGVVVAWGDNYYGQCTVPAGLSNVWDVAAGFAHSVALKKDGTVVAWGDNTFGETNVPSGLTNVVAIAAGGYFDAYPSEPYSGYTMALKQDGTVVVWGANEIAAPISGLNHVIAINGEYDSGLAIRSGPPTPAITLEPVDEYQIAGGSVTFTAIGQGLYGVTYQWQTNGVNLSGATNAALILTNLQAAQFVGYDVVVTDNGGMGSIVSSNATLHLVTAPVITSQTLPTNPVCIYGNYLAFAVTASAPYQTNGFPLTYQWQFDGTNISGATATNYNFYANDSSSGTYSVIVANAAGSVSASWQVTVTNAINVTNDLLLIYNTNSVDSTTVLNYYLAHRPMVGGANVLGIGCPGIYITNYPGRGEVVAVTNITDYETVSPSDFTNQVLNPVLNWLAANPAKRPQYVVLMLDVPPRINALATSATNFPFYPDFVSSASSFNSVSYQLARSVSGWQPFITHINMNGTNDCIGYINKLQYIGTNYSPGKLIISASVGGYGNTNWYFDDTVYPPYTSDTPGLSGAQALILDGIYSNSIIYTNVNPDTGYVCHIVGGTNVAGYLCWGSHSSLGVEFPLGGNMPWSGNSGWWIIETIESFNGERYRANQSNYIVWFLDNAFGGANYSNTPVGAVSNTDEPGFSGVNDPTIYFPYWENGKCFAICAWASLRPPYYFQAVGDPFVAK